MKVHYLVLDHIPCYKMYFCHSAKWHWVLSFFDSLLDATIVGFLKELKQDFVIY